MATTNNFKVIFAVPFQTSNVEHYKKVFPDSAILTCSALQILCGALSAILQIILILIGDPVSVIGSGIWCGFFFAISGSIGILAKIRPSICSFSAFMILSIWSICFSVTLLIIAGIGIGLNFTDDLILSGALNGCLILVALINGITAITTSAFCCRAVCCCKKSNQIFCLQTENDNQVTVQDI